MRHVLLIAVVGCSSPAAPPPAKPVPVTPPANLVELPKSCTDAAFGIDRAAKDLHPAEQEIVPVMRARCTQDAWSQTVINCFARMKSEGDDLQNCIALLPDTQRETVFAEIRGEEADQTAELADVVTKLATVSVGIANCDKFVEAVKAMMTCTAMRPDARIQLGTETAEAWSLPMHRVSLQDKAKLAGACSQSLESLKRHATDLACTL